MEDRELISGIKNKNKQVFKDFVEQYQKLVLNICYKFVNNSDDANDVAQEVFIEAYRSIDKFREDSKISTWLYRISVNKSLNFLRDNKKTKITDSYSGDVQKISADSLQTNTSPETNFINQERKEIIDKAINSLPDRQKTAFILQKKEDLSHEEISQVLGISVKAVESLIIRAKQNLQKKLISYYKS
jgi:RNA polymerase sigma-70 factor (ECF subfamily)